MAKIKWSPQSLEDIEAIANFITRDSSYYARMFTIKVFTETQHAPTSGSWHKTIAYLGK